MGLAQESTVDGKEIDFLVVLGAIEDKGLFPKYLLLKEIGSKLEICFLVLLKHYISR